MSEAVTEVNTLWDTHSSSYLLERLDRALNEALENRRRLDVHLTECAARFEQICFWLRWATIALAVMFVAQFLHVDITQIVKLLMPVVLK